MPPLLLGIPFLEFKGFAGFPLSAEKFPRWSFWVGHPGWQFFPFLCVGNQTLGGVSWVGHPGSLASSWWTFSDRWNYLSRNCWRLSSSPRLTWVEFRGWKFFAFLSLECRLLRWSFVDGSSLRFSFPEFLSWNLTKLLASLFLQRNFVGGVSWVGHPWGLFNEVAGFPLSAEKFRRWSFLGGTSWLAILSFLLFWEPNPRWNFLGGASWQLGVDLVKTWRMWSYLARNCQSLSSSARLIWVEFRDWKFLAFLLFGCKLVI